LYKRLHDTACDSVKLGLISDFAHRCWSMGLSQADWFGRLPADPEKFRIIVFRNRPQVQEHEIAQALDELANVRDGLIHLYQLPNGERYLVYHRHEKSTPTGNFKSKTIKYPPPPQSICKEPNCVAYHPEKETPANGVGESFRFAKDLFNKVSTMSQQSVEKKTDQSCIENNQKASSGLTSRENATGPFSSLLLSSSSLGREGCGEGRIPPITDKSDFGRLCQEFEKITGRPAVYGMMRPEEFRTRVDEAIGRWGLVSCIRTMREKSIWYMERNNGKPINSMLYVLAVLEDEKNFNGNGVKGGLAPDGAYSLSSDDLTKKLMERMEGADGGDCGGGSARDVVPGQDPQQNPGSP